MEHKRANILLISHEASNSGAPILLLNKAKHLAAIGQTFDVLLIRDGHLKASFEAVAKKVYTVDALSSFLAKTINRIKYRINRKTEDITAQTQRVFNALKSNQYDLVYGNSLATLHWMLPFKQKGIKCICAIHELTLSVESIYSKAYVQENINKIDVIVAGSQSVGDNLIARYGADKEKVTVIHSFVDGELKINQSPAIVKQALDIQEGQIVFGLASSQELRKGTDLVPLLVKEIVKQAPELDFVFINLGGQEGNVFVRNAKLDAEKLQVLDKIKFINHTTQVDDYINIYDVFVMLSREDPFPLVTLTAAKLAKPIIAFQNSGGADEFLANDIGILVPYLDIQALAAQLIHLANKEADRKRLGTAAHTALLSKYAKDIAVEKLVNLIDKTLKA
jgi:glycosyltransferase involved in cell wall biosynthesis